MYFNKFLHPENFEFPGNISADYSFSANGKPYKLDLKTCGDNIHRLTVRGGPWKSNASTWQPFPDGVPEENATTLGLSLKKKPFNLELSTSRGQPLLKSAPGRAFGICGEQFVMAFTLEGNENFYGMGEKFLGLELSNCQSKFWNTDAMGDFAPPVFTDGRPDPAYVSIPYLIIRKPSGWIGILVNNPGAVQINTGAAVEVEGFMEVGDAPKQLLIGADHGQPDVFFLYGRTLPELTRSFQSLVGTTPLPPVWSLGYHQCRWGYASAADLRGLKKRLAKEKIPTDGLWLDIDYMDGYRVFTFADKHFPNVEEDLRELQSEGQHVVPIIDPGVKIDPEWGVYRDGLKADVYCKNPQGKTFVGQVWPGDTAFVDYTQKKGMRWWADQVEAFAKRGIHGCWNDMNDPSTGFVENSVMLWGNGKKPHWTNHNQFARQMAESTRNGFLSAHPDERPFILSRSGSTGMGRVAAIWHGDSTANRHWLKLAIPTALNLSLSGVSFNGPDLGGFGGDTTPDLFVDYIKACFLFPFCRNHTAIHTARQEPWAFKKELPVIRDYIQDRYRLRPYLYQLFADQEERGEAVLRPLFYEFNQKDFLKLEDQFMVGPALMQAPLLDGSGGREVQLPPGRWWNFMTSRWIEGDRKMRVRPDAAKTPLYARAGTAVPMTVETPETHHWDGTRFDLHLFLEPGTRKRASGTLVSDDGQSFGYRRGERTRVRYSAVAQGDTLRITTRTLEEGFGALDLNFVLYGGFKTVIVNRKETKPSPHRYRLAGAEQTVYRV